MVISQAFIQEQGNELLRQEERRVVEELNRRRIPITFYTEKRIRRRQLSLDYESLVVGDLPCISGALKQLSIISPLGNTIKTIATKGFDIDDDPLIYES
ncbi:hypothetical protein H1P_210010 [Hyella patelloides LEGE 07179]|uniref:Uncharacterized protein n=1 Tax=Hyella patelloides LEGE 07179 TaxID=945734 RepID=A0A563VQH2_9CYAN|nr:hypothetical protein [Hyella patelloides]VEP13629.1 hypothetical protein H1P_210010 [Hyella patelloides LEGE 07179]